MRELLIGILLASCAAEVGPAELTWATVDGGRQGADAGRVPSPDVQAAAGAAPESDIAKGQDVEAAPDLPPQDTAPQLDCSDTCKALGWCAPVGQACAATADTDCDTAWICQLEGKCVAKAGKCVLGNDKGCHVLSACKAEGLCTWNAAKSKCVAMWDSDCAESDVCKSAGKCKPVYGQCKS